MHFYLLFIGLNTECDWNFNGTIVLIILVVSWKQPVKYKFKLVLGYSQTLYDSLR